jgi:hypothetical protein
LNTAFFETANKNFESTCIIDTDIATGATKDIMLKIFPKATFFAPIKLSINQDLIDIEDLILKRTLLWSHNKFSYVNYLLNETFFHKRTSISYDRYSQINSIVKDFLV